MLQLLRKPFRGAVSSGNLRILEKGRQPKRGAGKKAVGVYEFISASRIYENTLADCSYVPRDCRTPPPYNRKGVM